MEQKLAHLRTRLLASRTNLLGGTFLLAVALTALFQGSDLAFGTLATVGPGFMPLILAAILGLLSVWLLISSVCDEEGGTGIWSLRPLIFILGALVIFGLTLRPLGLVLAGPLVVIVSSLGSKETRPIESVVFALGMTAFCIGLFRFALKLPIPVAPFWLGY